MSNISKRNKYIKHVQNTIDNTVDFRLIPSSDLNVASELIDRLDIDRVGDYKIIISPVIPVSGGAGAVGQVEIDLAVVNKFGLFGIDIKNISGKVTAYDDEWLQETAGKKIQHRNPLASLHNKCRILHHQISIFYKSISVVPLIVLTQGLENFVNQSGYRSDSIVGIDDLPEALSNPNLRFRSDENILTNDEISRISKFIFELNSSNRLSGDSTTDAPPPDVNKKKKKGK